MRRFVCALVVVAACGGTSEPTQRSAGADVSPIATQRGADDVVVAQVNGRPVWGSCVTAQAIGNKTKQQALDECVAFELLAQEADARGLAKDPDVVEETRTALVNRVVEIEFEDRYKTPADLADVIARHIDRNKGMLDRPEGRSSVYARYNLKENAPPEEEAKGKAIAEQLAARLANEPGLTTPHFQAIVAEVAGGTKLELATVSFRSKSGLVLPYADALFAIPEIGRTSRAVRTPWGWDVILLSAIVPAVKYTREEAAIEAFPEVRRGYFNIWVDQLAKANGTRITIDPKQVAKLDEAGP